MRTWIWRHLAVELPDEWEMLQFSRDRAAGRCAFADRYRFRLELSWRQVAGPPDFERMLHDYEARLTERGMTDGRRVQRGAWRGLSGRLGGQPMTRYGIHVPGEACLVETVFIWPGAVDPVLEKNILGSLCEAPPEADGDRRWRAFGLDMRVPAGLELTDLTVQPAHAEAHFAKGRTDVRFARRGLVPTWLRTPVDAWLRHGLPSDARPAPAGTRSLACGTHAVAQISGLRRTGRVFGKVRPFRAEAWICPSDGRLYSWIGTGDPFDHAARRPLACCAEGVTPDA
ncbi:MAG: hypothetical protein K8T26_06185 [Lentisphaerae bacterium]|nr:hypothetical protein [Lentisphaerota bacterium]